MEQTKRSKVTERKPFGDKDQYGNYSFIVTFENSDSGFYKSTSDSPKHFVIGSEEDYTIETLTAKSGKDYHKIKPISDKKPFTGGFSRPFNPDQDAKKQAMIVLQSSLAQSNQFHAIAGYSDKAQDLGAKLKETFATAEWFAKRILESPLLIVAPTIPPANGADLRNKPFENAQPINLPKKDVGYQAKTETDEPPF